MKLIKKYDQKKIISEKIIRGLTIGISRILSKFHINLNSFYDELIVETIKRTYKRNNKIYETALLTGVDHRVVSKIVKNKYSSKAVKGSRMEMIIVQELNKSSKHCKNMMVRIKGDLNSLDIILKKHGFSYVRLRTVIDSLVLKGVIEERGDYIKFLGNEIKNKQQNEDYIGMISRQFNRYSKTVIYNRDQILSEKPSLYDLTVFSTQIHPNKHSELESIIYNKCRDFHKEIDSLLGSYETYSPGTFEEFGVSILQYNLNKR